VVDDGWADAVTTPDRSRNVARVSVNRFSEEVSSANYDGEKSSKIKTSSIERSQRLSMPHTSNRSRTRWNSTSRCSIVFFLWKKPSADFFDEKESGLRAKQVRKLDRLELNSSEWSLLKILSQLLAVRFQRNSWAHSVTNRLGFAHLLFIISNSSGRIRIDNEEEQCWYLQVTFSFNAEN
jgi:hypothetical protein